MKKSWTRGSLKDAKTLFTIVCDTPPAIIWLLTLAISGQEVLENLAAAGPDPLKGLYKSKSEANADLENIFQGTVSKGVLDAFFQKSQRNWEAVGNFIISVLPRYIADHDFIGGSTPREADSHIGAYLARIAPALGGNDEIAGASCFEVLRDVPKSVDKYWDNWVIRESWRTVYKVNVH